MKKLIVVFCSILLTLHVAADSPLTSTFFAMAYNDVPVIGSIMQQRMSTGNSNIELAPEHMAFLDNAGYSLDQKIALINGLGWGDSNNTEIYIQHLMKKYNLTHSTFDSLLVFRIYPDIDMWQSGKVINQHDLMSLSYIQVMGDYFNPLVVGNVVDYTFVQMQDSQAAACVVGLVLSQVMLDIDWCGVYQGFDVVRYGTFTKDVMRPAALQAIYEYIDLYASSCEEASLLEQYTNQVGNSASRLVMSLDYFTDNPCYIKPMDKQVSTKETNVDLELLNDNSGKQTMHGNWVVYNESAAGTDLTVQIKNNGNTTSLSTNLLLMVMDSEMNAMYMQTEIPPIEPGATTEIILTIINYWVYSPNADFKITLDYDNNIEELNEDNNSKYFNEEG
jgi:CARDB